MRVFDSMRSEHLTQRMRDTLFDHIMHLPYTWHIQNHTGDIIQRCTSDVETIKVFVSEQLTQLFRVILLIIFSLYFMITINFTLAMADAVFIPIIVIGSIYFHYRIGATFQAVDEEEGKLSNIVQENLTGVRVVWAFGQENFECRRFEKQNHGYTRLWVHLQKILAAFWTYGNVVATTRILCGDPFCAFKVV